MIKLENVTKIYQSVKGERHYALRNINLSLPETGMVFVLILSLVVFILGLIMTVLVIDRNNKQVASFTLPNIIVTYFTLPTFITVFVSSIVLLNLATLIPLRKVAGLKPIDAIKHLIVI